MSSSRNDRMIRDIYQEKRAMARHRREGDSEPLTKSQERAQRALDAARRGASGAERIESSYERGTSIARVRRHGNEDSSEEQLDKKTAAARIGLAPPLPQSVLRPKKPLTDEETRNWSA